jgi:hypothetical protein
LTGLENRKLSGTHGFLDWTAVPETTFGSNATVKLKISIEEGPQYHMGKLETVGDKQLAARLSADWNLAEGNVYDRTYIDQFLETNRDSLPVGFSRANAQTIQNCPDALVEVRLILDPAEELRTQIRKTSRANTTTMSRSSGVVKLTNSDDSLTPRSAHFECNRGYCDNQSNSRSSLNREKFHL